MDPNPPPQSDPKPTKDAPKINFVVNPEKKKVLLTELIQTSQTGDKKKAKYLKDLLSNHKYWDERPMLREDADQEPGNVQGVRTVEQVRKEPLELPLASMQWCVINVKDDRELDEFYHLLSNNYVEDEDNVFRFDYSREFLRWALTPPAYQSNWLVGVRDNAKPGKPLVASITGVPVHTMVEELKIKMAEINFLCVHKQYRTHRMTPLLISEVTRRVNLTNRWQAIYTAGRTLPTPFTRATYYHRSLNPKKLIEIRFSALGPNQTIPKVMKLYRVPQEPTIEGLRPMVKRDVCNVFKLVNEGLSKYKVKFFFTEQQIGHFFLPRDKIMYTYIVEREYEEDGKKKKKVTDLISFYSLPSHVMRHPKHTHLNVWFRNEGLSFDQCSPNKWDRPLLRLYLLTSLQYLILATHAILPKHFHNSFRRATRFTTSQRQSHCSG